MEFKFINFKDAYNQDMSAFLYISNRLADVLNLDHGRIMKKRLAIFGIVNYIQKHRLLRKDGSFLCDQTLHKVFEKNHEKCGGKLVEGENKELWIPFSCIKSHINSNMSLKKFPPDLPQIPNEKKIMNMEIRQLYDAPYRPNVCSQNCRGTHCCPVFRRGGEGFYETMNIIEHLNAERIKIGI